VRTRPVAAAALLYALLALALYSPALIPGRTLSASDFLWTAAPWAAERPPDVRPFGSNYELIDSAVQFQPWLEHSRDRFPEPPLWNPQVGIGRPFLANAQSAWLSPFSLPAYVLPFWWAMGVVAVLKVFAAAFGTFLLARALAMGYAGALLAGVVYGFSLYMLVWISWPQSGVWALLPWLLLLAERVIRRPGPLPAAGLAAVVALQFFAGHPESSFHLLVTTVVFFAFRLIVLRRGRELSSLRGPLVAFAAAMAGGAALSAITLIPFLELLFRSGDVELRQNFSELALPERYLLGFTLYDYWGRATHTAVGAFAQERALYVGAVPLLLALAAPFTRPTLQRTGVAVFAVVTLAIALGLPPFPEIAQRIPIVRTGNHLRVVVLAMLALALLAGWGLEDLRERAVPRRALIGGLAAALLVVPVAILAARGQLPLDLLGRAAEIAAGTGWPEPPADGDDLPAIRLAALLVWLVFMGLAAALVAARLGGRLAPAAFAALAIGLVAADLLKAGMGATPAIDTDVAEQPSTPGLERLRSGGRFVGLERPLGPSPLIPNMALRWSLQDARSYDLPVEKRYDTLWRRAVKDGGPTETPTTAAVLTERALPAFRLMGVTAIAQDPADPVVRRPRLAVAYDEEDLRIYANPRAMPRVAVVGGQTVVDGEDAELDAVLEPGFDGRRAVVTSTPLPGLASAPAPGPAGTARIVSEEPERVVVEAVARRPAELVLADLHYPGWKVTLDSAEAPLHRVDYLLRGTTLPPGRHRVVFSYEPLSWRIGWIFSLVALAGLAAALVAGARGRRRATSYPAAPCSPS
jgi:hypothetical protein